MYIALETRASLAGQQLVVAVGGGSWWWQLVVAVTARAVPGSLGPKSA